MIDTGETIRLLAKLILRQDEKINELREEIARMSKYVEVYETYIKEERHVNEGTSDDIYKE